MRNVYSHLTSGGPRRASAALSLLASIVRRGRALAWEVARAFDFSLSVLPKLVRAFAPLASVQPPLFLLPPRFHMS